MRIVSTSRGPGHLTNDTVSLWDTDLTVNQIIAAAPFPSDLPVVETVGLEDVDILAPCALGGIINDDTLPQLKVEIVAGAARWIPVVAPVIEPPTIRGSGPNDRTASFSIAEAVRSHPTTLTSPCRPWLSTAATAPSSAGSPVA